LDFISGFTSEKSEELTKEAKFKAEKPCYELLLVQHQALLDLCKKKK